MTQTRQEMNRNLLSLLSGSFLSGYAMRATRTNRMSKPNGFSTMAHIQPSMT